jgi:hypothetical protein
LIGCSREGFRPFAGRNPADQTQCSQTRQELSRQTFRRPCLRRRPFTHWPAQFNQGRNHAVGLHY